MRVEERPRPLEAAAADGPPFVTVVMPVRNEARYIERSLGGVLAQDYPADRMEVLVVDGMSTDDTRDAVRRLAERTPAAAPVRILDNPSRVVPAALNIGIEGAAGEVVVRVDGHCELPADYVSRCVDLLRETGADNVGGLQVGVGDGVVGRATALAANSPFGTGGAAFRTSERPGWVETVYLGAWPRDVFARIGGFDEEMVRNQDDELNFRLVQSGGRIWLDPSIRCTYHSRERLGAFWRQYYQYGKYKVRLMQKRGALPAWRHAGPPALVLAVAGSLVLAAGTRRPGWAAAVLGPYAAANLMASVAAARRDPRALPALPPAYACIHFGYGLGFLAGVWRWRRLFGRRRSPG
ncbi:MAG: glycosyltransferase family 2 protein, partial [Actinomycetota bacterium]|nr:glycosyltransferase family 2 protein [Actinomycetota bacterium]